MNLGRNLGRVADRLVEAVDPERALRRAHARSVMAFASSEAGYLIPGGPQKSMRGINVTNNSPALDIDDKLEGSRALSKDFAMNSALAVSIFRRSKTNVVSAGLQVQPRVDRNFLGLSDAQADEFNDTATREFDLWANSFESDYSGMATFGENQVLLFLASLISGDGFFALPWVKSDRAGWPYETAVKIIDADLVRSPDDDMSSYLSQATNAKIRNGVEFDASGRLAAYHVANFYKNDSYDAQNQKFIRIPVYDKLGERQIFHLLEHERIGQRRGMPMLAPVVDELKMVSRLNKAELTSALIAAMFSVFVRDANNYGYLQQGFTPSESITGGGGDGPDATQESKDSGYEWDVEIGPGNVNYLDKNKDISIAETRKKADFAPFMKSMAGLVSSAAEIPLDFVLLQFDKSYSALRGAALEAEKRWKAQRAIMATRVCQPIYENVIREAVVKGRIKAPKFFEDPIYRAAWCRSQWVGAGSGQIDPLKEARASVIKIGYGLSTREEEYAMDRGGRFGPMIERLARENAMVKELGIIDPQIETLESVGRSGA